MEHCLEAGEVEIPVKKGIIAAEDIHEIGTLIAGGVTGRTSDDDITIYDPAGMALLDIAAAKVAAIKAKTYTGKVLKPKPKVTLNGKELSPGIDFTIKYKKNVKRIT